MAISKKMRGYLLGVLLSAAAAVLTGCLIRAYFRAMLVKCAMSLGCAGGVSLVPPLLLLGGYLLLALALAVFERRVFNAKIAAALPLNVAPLVALTALSLLSVQYEDYARRRDSARAARNALGDAPAVRLGAAYVKKVDRAGGGVTFFLHVPFAVTEPVRARSLNILAATESHVSDVRFSPNPECNDAYTTPTYGFHIVDREHDEPPLPAYVSGVKIASDQLLPGKQYYLLQEIHFTYSRCRIEDYRDFDPRQLGVTLESFAAERMLEGR